MCGGRPGERGQHQQAAAAQQRAHPHAPTWAHCGCGWSASSPSHHWWWWLTAEAKQSAACWLLAGSRSLVVLLASAKGEEPRASSPGRARLKAPAPHSRPTCLCRKTKASDDGAGPASIDRIDNTASQLVCMSTKTQPKPRPPVPPSAFPLAPLQQQARCCCSGLSRANRQAVSAKVAVPAARVFPLSFTRRLTHPHTALRGSIYA
jgi:hypothetical protein